MTSGGNAEGPCKKCGGWTHGVNYRWDGLCMACATKEREKVALECRDGSNDPSNLHTLDDISLYPKMAGEAKAE